MRRFHTRRSGGAAADEHAEIAPLPAMIGPGTMWRVPVPVDRCVVHKPGTAK